VRGVKEVQEGMGKSAGDVRFFDNKKRRPPTFRFSWARNSCQECRSYRFDRRKRVLFTLYSNSLRNTVIEAFGKV
jgi:hypothetical protein